MSPDAGSHSLRAYYDLILPRTIKPVYTVTEAEGVYQGADSKVPARDWVAFWWAVLSSEVTYFDHHSHPHGEIHGELKYVDRALHYLAAMIVKAGLADHVQALGDPNIGGRTLAVPLLQCAVSIMARHPSQWDADRELRRLLVAITDTTSEEWSFASAARLVLAQDLRDEVLGAHPSGRADGNPARRSGRPRLDDPKANEKRMALRNAYENVRRVLQPGRGPMKLLNYFRDKKDFRDLVRQAGRDFNKHFFRSAIAWIKANPRSENRVRKGILTK
jgi:hypothetical protein